MYKTIKKKSPSVDMHIVGFFIISVENANFRNEEVIERLLSFKKKIFWGICSSQLFSFFGGDVSVRKSTKVESDD